MKLNRVRRRRRDVSQQALIDDRLIKLPNDVLLNIMERLDALDAVRTCAVSKRTLNLPALLSQIVIVLSTDDLRWKNLDVADATDKILITRSPSIPICMLKLRFVMKSDTHLRIDRSVALAMAAHKIDAAEFEILTQDIHYRRQSTDDDLLDSAKMLNGFIGECPGAFAGLTRLHLHNLRFPTESDMPNILTTCKRLESLCLSMCDAGISSVWHVEHARLVELHITAGKFLTIHLDCVPNLQRMTYNHWPYFPNDPFTLGFVPQLSNLALSHRYKIVDNTLNLSHMLVNAPPIRDLHLNFQSGKIWIRPECPKVLAPVLRKLRLVNLDNLPEECDIAWTMFFLEATPYLEELCVTIWDHNCQNESQKSNSQKTDVKWEPSTPDFKHKNFARLTIYGFQSDDKFIGYVRRVIEAAVNIKEVSLHDRKVCQLCANKFPHAEVHPSSYPHISEEVDFLRKQMKSEKAAASPHIHFHSLGRVHHDPGLQNPFIS